ncbi:hypothetical protein RB195_004461 [Necator americanus]|uniref:Uncharacterized protein n=1 Tax=Necator americanus TaxID=51031 RepID=A0ABR1BLD2_NECAM
MAKNIDSFELLTTRIGRLRMKRCGPTPALTIFVAYAQATKKKKSKLSIWTWRSSTEKIMPFTRKIFLHKRAEKAAKFGERNPRTIINWDLFATLADFWEHSETDNIDEEYDRLVEHLHDCAKKSESFKITKIRLPLETLVLIHQREAARAAGNQELMSELARLCREAINEDLKERGAELLAETAEAGKSIRFARQNFASRKTRMTALQNPKGTTTASRRGMVKIISTSTLISSTAIGSPVRNTTCYHVGKKSYGTRSRQNKTRTPEEPSASTHQHPGEALFTSPVGMQGLKKSWKKDSHASKQAFEKARLTTFTLFRKVQDAALSYLHRLEEVLRLS